MEGKKRMAVLETVTTTFLPHTKPSQKQQEVSFDCVMRAHMYLGITEKSFKRVKLSE